MTRQLRLLLLPCVTFGAVLWLSTQTVVTQNPVPVLSEAPAGFDNQTNGFASQADFDAALTAFGRRWTVADGLGPVYNAQSCAECHANPVPGAASQTSALRAGHFNGFAFVEHPGGSLIADRAIDASIQERILAGNEVRTFRMSTSALGAGFVEAIDSNTLVAIANSQPASMRGTFVQVPVLEASNATVRVGRFGWKNQHASLLSMASEELLDEIGITSRLQPIEQTSNGNSIAAFDHVADPEDIDNDIDQLALLLRSTKAPPRDAALAAAASAQRGATLFSAIGCSTCHVGTIATAPAGTVINSGAFTVPPALGSKVIHPYSDFLLHDIGTGDGIVQNAGQGTRDMLRTPPLWGLRSRVRLMHDGLTVSRTDAIERHGGQASAARQRFFSLSAPNQSDVINFLNSL